jgi:hypothetical protein
MPGLSAKESQKASNRVVAAVLSNRGGEIGPSISVASASAVRYRWAVHKSSSASISKRRLISLAALHSRRTSLSPYFKIWTA